MPRRLTTCLALLLLAGCAANMRPEGTPTDALTFTGGGLRGGSAYAVAIHLTDDGRGTVALDSDCRNGARIEPSTIKHGDAGTLSFRAFGCGGRTVGVEIQHLKLIAGKIESGELVFLQRRDNLITTVGQPMLLSDK
ncbi:hypothetical protein [Plasticicumulans acidivorans]|uniref:Lipoprotein n=1 Tax=Plasticicumulans acidivorans TaxID=886464 RepID=A0A317MUU6_9GAMM|nr:hypothetical protein [Plasticicumulans acidivorans]PWV61157.1 hypothetical protein C7443_106171 [Plasticicumulans acidivorans]